MDGALELLGSFAEFVQQRDPELAVRLTPLVLEWARLNDIPLSQLLQLLPSRSDVG